MSEPVDTFVPIPPFEVTDEEFAFPEGQYLIAFGGVRAVFPKDDAEAKMPDAVTHDLWTLKYLGTPEKPANDVRISLTDSKIQMKSRGVRIVERYPNPAKMPKLAFRARAFFCKFPGCIEELNAGFDAYGNPNIKKVVSWEKVQLKYGLVFTVKVIYQKSKVNSKNYRNFDYESIIITSTVIPPDQMRLIEAQYEAQRAKESVGEVEAPPTASDLPF